MIPWIILGLLYNASLKYVQQWCLGVYGKSIIFVVILYLTHIFTFLSNIVFKNYFLLYFIYGLIFSFYKCRKLTTFCRAVYTFVKTALQKMQEEHLWMRRMTYNICVQCPVCSKGGVQASECDIHHVAGCKRDQCLHYITEDEIVGDRDLVCCQSDDAMNRDISREQFKPWFETLDSKVCTTLV